MQRFQCNSALYSPPAPVCFLSVPCLPTRRAPHGITRNVCNGARNGGCEEAPTDCFCLLGMTSHRFHRSTQMVWVRKIIPQIEQNSQNLLLGITSNRLHRSHRSLCWEYSPTDFTDLHRWLGCVDSSGGILASAAAKCLPQIAQIYTDGLSAKDHPTEYAEFTEPSAGDNLPQIAQMQFQGVRPNHLCKSVKSVGEYTQQEVLWILWNLWENIRSKSGFGGRAYNYHEAVMPLPQTCNSVTS